MRQCIFTFIFNLGATLLFAQESRNLTGTVRDASTGDGLSGVTIATEMARVTTKTNEEGKYQIQIRAVDTVLTFSMVGYEKQVIAVQGKSQVDVLLTPSSEQLGEVVVVGYGTQRKIETTGSIASVKADELTQMPVVNVAQGLQARVAGVQINQNSGSPGGNISMRIRGTNSINGSSEPLYVVDGIQISNGGGINDVSPLSTINPNDIESVEVLKDASASAIYGARAANGVVLITTKRGKAGVTRVELDSYYGVQSVAKTLNVLNAAEFAQLENEVFNDNFYSDPAALGEGVNWQNLIFQDAPIQNHQLSINGGNDKTQLALSLNYFNQDGVIINSSFERYSYRLNMDHRVNDRFKVGTSILGSYSVNHGISAGSTTLGDAGVVTGSVLGAALGAPPTLAPYREDGSIFPFAEQRGGRYREVVNPLNFTEILQQRAIKRTLANVYGEYTILPGLSYRASFNVDIDDRLHDTYSPLSIIAEQDLNENSGNASKYNRDFLNLLHESLITYTTNIGEDHSLKLTGLFATQSESLKVNLIEATGFPNDATKNEALQLALNRNVSSERSRLRLDSYMARANYGYKDKIFVDITARVDGSSKFGANNKYGFFPAISAAWRLIEEPLFQNFNQLSDLKLRASYGTTGNADGIDPYQSLAMVAATGGYNFNHLWETGIATTGIANPNLRWEKSTQTNVGIDASFFDGRWSIVADYYHKRTDDLLFVKALPFSSGYQTITGNFASLQNRGFELATNAVIVDSDLHWSVAANITMNRNKILDLDGGVTDERFMTNFTLLKVGEPLGVFKTYVFDGINQSGEDIISGYDGRTGGHKVRDVNNDGLINTDDQIITGDPNPDFIFGFSTNLQYKNFDLGVLLSGSYGNDIYNISRLSFENPLGQRNLFQEMVDRWTPENPSNQYVSPFVAGRLPITDYAMEDGSYLRVRNINLGYTWNGSGKINRIRVYVSANNPFTWTKYSGFDPEVNSYAGSNTIIGIDNLVYPQARSYLAGLQVSF
ncbi:TonB-dependent receptor [Olivibacter sp. SDN3]|nr:TonB-dependent receptor [Olivibacter sp. SDN3]